MLCLPSYRQVSFLRPPLSCHFLFISSYLGIVKNSDAFPTLYMDPLYTILSRIAKILYFFHWHFTGLWYDRAVGGRQMKISQIRKDW